MNDEMNNPMYDPTHDSDQQQEIAPDEPVSGLEDSLRALRLRRYESRQQWSTPESAPDEGDIEEQGEIDGSGASHESAPDEESEENQDQLELSAAIEEMSQEIRRVGREMFRASRVSERNQEIFEEAVKEIRDLSANVALIPAQHNDAVQAARYEAKAEMCRELLRMSDTLASSLSAVDELLADLNRRVQQPVSWAASQFAGARERQQSLLDAAVRIKQWREGQQLLGERLGAILRTAGVREIESIGRAFDPELHRAVSVKEPGDASAGTILGEELKGYTLEGRILRYAEVIVAK